MKKFLIPAGVLAFVPSVAFAQELTDILFVIANLIDTATPIIVALALLFFFWGLTIFILNQSNEEKKTEGRNIMVWGIIALFIMLSVFGIIRILQNTFDVERTISPGVPRVDVDGASNILSPR